MVFRVANSRVPGAVRAGLDDENRVAFCAELYYHIQSEWASEERDSPKEPFRFQHAEGRGERATKRTLFPTVRPLSPDPAMI